MAEEEQHAADVYEGEQLQSTANQELGNSESPSDIRASTRARFSCTWKECDYRGNDANETK